MVGKRQLLTTLLILCALSLLAGCPYVSVSVSTSTPPGGGTPGHFESTNNGFSFDYPTDWQLTSGKFGTAAGAGPLEVVGVVAPDGTAVGVAVYQLNKAVPDADLPVIKQQIDRIVASVVDQSKGELIISQQTLVAGRNVFEYRLKRPQAGKTTESRQLYLILADREYLVTMDGDETAQNQYAKVPEQIVGSLKSASTNTSE